MPTSRMTGSTSTAKASCSPSQPPFRVRRKSVLRSEQPANLEWRLRLSCAESPHGLRRISQAFPRARCESVFGFDGSDARPRAGGPGSALFGSFERGDELFQPLPDGLLVPLEALEGAPRLGGLLLGLF